MSSGGGFSGSGGGFSGGGGGYSGGFGPPMGGFGQPMGGFGGFGGGFGQPFGGGFQPPQYGGGFGQPFGGGFQQPQYGGGFGFQPPQFGGFQNQGPGNAYARQNPYQPPPGMEPNPYYKPSNRYTDDVRISDMQYRPIQRANPATGVMPSEPISDPNERGFSTQATIRSTKDGVSGYYTDGSMSHFVPDERQLGPAIQPNPGFRRNFSDYGDAMRDQGVGFGNPYGGYGAPYGGSPYMGMLGGLGGFFGGNGFQGMNQQAQAQAQAQQAALQNQRQFPQGSFSLTTISPDGLVAY